MSRWSDEYFVLCYQLASDGLTLNAIAEQLGVLPGTLSKWRKTKPALNKAIEEGFGRNKDRKKVKGLQDYLYQQLSPKLQKLWVELTRCAKHKNPIQRMEALFDRHGEEARMHMWLHAYSTSHWNATVACKKVGISVKQFKKWMEDPVFSEMIDEMHFHKGEFFDSKLVDLVHSGDSKAIMFVNRTYNRGKGYAEKLEVEHSGNVQHEHRNVLDVTRLPVKLQQQIMEYMEQQEALDQKQLGYNGDQ